MMLSNLLNVALALCVAPSLVNAAIFPKDSKVKMLDAKSFKKAMKANQTSLVAFVAPWCGHCQRMVPEYSKAASSLHPLIPAYAVDCDAEKNKPLCAQQGVQGFPTVKLFPRGKSLPPMLYEQERSSSGFFYFATRRVPNHIAKLSKVGEIPGWIKKSKTKHRALLLTKDKKIPLLWKVLANKYDGTDLDFGTHRDQDGKSSVEMGMDAGGQKEAKVLLYPIGSDKPVRYQGLTKFDLLSKFFDSVLDGTVDLSQVLKPKSEEDEKEIDPEKDVKEGADNTEYVKKDKPAKAAAAGEQCTQPGVDSKDTGSCGPPASDTERPKDEL